MLTNYASTVTVPALLDSSGTSMVNSDPTSSISRGWSNRT